MTSSYRATSPASTRATTSRSDIALGGFSSSFSPRSIVYMRKGCTTMEKGSRLQALPHLELVAHLPDRKRLHCDLARALLLVLGADRTAEGDRVRELVGNDADVARSERRIHPQLLRDLVLDARVFTLRDGLSVIDCGDRYGRRDRQFVDDAVDAGDFERDLFGALTIGLRAHDAVERCDSVAYEHAHVAICELLVEPRLHLERETGVAGAEALARGRRARGRRGLHLRDGGLGSLLLLRRSNAGGRERREKRNKIGVMAAHGLSPVF